MWIPSFWPATEKINGLTHSLVGRLPRLLKTASLSSNLFMDNGSSYSGLILPNLPPESQFLCLFKGHFTTTDPEARIRNIGNCARVRTLDRLFPFWEGEKRPAKYVNQMLAAAGCAHRLNQIGWNHQSPMLRSLRGSKLRLSDPWRRSQNGQLLLAMRQWKKDSGENNLPKAPLLRVMLNNSFGLVICASTPSGEAPNVKWFLWSLIMLFKPTRMIKTKSWDFAKKNLIGHSINTIATRTACLDLSQMWSWLASSKEKSKRTCGQNAPW